MEVDIAKGIVNKYTCRECPNTVVFTLNKKNKIAWGFCGRKCLLKFIENDDFHFKENP